MGLSLRLRAAALAVLAVAIAPVLAACNTTPPPAKSVSGTVSGADGRVVDVMFGFDVLDVHRAKIDMGSLKVGYSALQRLNYCVPVTGAATSGQVCPNGKRTGFTWSLNLPQAAAFVYVEAYPKAPTGSDWINNYQGYTGVAAGSTDLSRYAMAYRPNIPIVGAVRGIDIKLPLVCGTPGGTTGTLAGHISGWRPGASGEVDAWAYGSTNPALGFGIGAIDGMGNYRVPALASGQRYVLVAHNASWSRNFTDTTVLGNATLVPGPCTTKVFNFGV
jgi:hypothetical protein